MWLKGIATQRFPATTAGGNTRKALWFGLGRRPVAQRLRRWFHFSLIRLALLESRSAYYRIRSERCNAMALEFQEVRRSLPQVSCSDSRNETQYCTASITKSSEDFPYLTLGDYRLFAAGFFQAEKWFLRTGMQCRNGQQDSPIASSQGIIAGATTTPPQSTQPNSKHDL